MTPEEILAECPELIFERSISGRPIFMIKDSYVPTKVATALAQSRKEARELREKNEKLVESLEFSRLKVKATYNNIDRKMFVEKYGELSTIQIIERLSDAIEKHRVL